MIGDFPNQEVLSVLMKNKSMSKKRFLNGSFPNLKKVSSKGKVSLMFHFQSPSLEINLTSKVVPGIFHMRPSFFKKLSVWLRFKESNRLSYCIYRCQT